MPKPSTTPRWADGVEAIVATPTEGKKSIGWVAQEEPPQGFMNWLALHAYNWFNWLNGVHSAKVRLLPASSAHAVAQLEQHTIPAILGHGRGTNAAINPGVDNGAHWVFDDDPGGSGQHVSIPILLDVGETLGSVHVWVAVPEGTATLTVYKRNLSAQTVVTLGTPDSSSGTSNQVLAVDDIVEVGAADHTYFAVLTTTASGGDNLTIVYGGHYETQHEAASHSYDPETDTWTGVTNLLVHFPIPVTVGETITAFASRIKDASGNATVMKLYRQADGVLTQIGTTVTSAASGAVQTLSQTLDTPHVVLDGNSYFLYVASTNKASVVYLGKATVTTESL